MNWLNEGVNEYYEWLKKRTFVQKDGTTEWSVVSTPFVGLFNDTIDLFVKLLPDGNVVLSDDGNTLSNLELLGVNFKSSTGRRDILDRVKLNYGVAVTKDGELMKTVVKTDFVQGKHDMIRAMLELSDMANLSTHRVASIFRDDVKVMLHDRKVNVTPGFIASGRSGIRFTFDYLIAKPEVEIVLQAFDHLDRPNLATFLFGVDEVKPVREQISEKKFQPIAIINDVENKVKGEYLDALHNREIDFMLWSNRDKEGFMRNIA
jgi:hypothetical protein